MTVSRDTTPAPTQTPPPAIIMADKLPAADNLRHWRVLERTDPEATKAFKRSGGFSGKSIKPIYTLAKMTQLFGPIGIGWGFTQPQYQYQTLGDVVMVFCQVSLWYDDNGRRSEPVWGTGGDILSTRRKDGTMAYDDEALKKAQTDAQGNAMKMLGMSADIHMGLHEDDKYVESLQAELHGRPAAPPAKLAGPPPELFPIVNLEGEIIGEFPRAKHWCDHVTNLLMEMGKEHRLLFWNVNEPMLRRFRDNAEKMPNPAHRVAVGAFLDQFQSDLMDLLPIEAPPPGKAIDDEIPF